MACTGISTTFSCGHIHTVFTCPNGGQATEHTHNIDRLSVDGKCPKCIRAAKPFPKQVNEILDAVYKPCTDGPYHLLMCGHVVRTHNIASCRNNCERLHQQPPRTDFSLLPKEFIFICPTCTTQHFQQLEPAVRDQLIHDLEHGTYRASRGDPRLALSPADVPQLRNLTRTREIRILASRRARIEDLMRGEIWPERVDEEEMELVERAAKEEVEMVGWQHQDPGGSSLSVEGHEAQVKRRLALLRAELSEKWMAW